MITIMTIIVDLIMRMAMVIVISFLSSFNHRTMLRMIMILIAIVFLVAFVKESPQGCLMQMLLLFFRLLRYSHTIKLFLSYNFPYSSFHSQKSCMYHSSQLMFLPRLFYF